MLPAGNDDSTSASLSQEHQPVWAALPLCFVSLLSVSLHVRLLVLLCGFKVPCISVSPAFPSSPSRFLSDDDLHQGEQEHLSLSRALIKGEPEW